MSENTERATFWLRPVGQKWYSSFDCWCKPRGILDKLAHRTSQYLKKIPGLVGFDYLNEIEGKIFGLRTPRLLWSYFNIFQIKEHMIDDVEAWSEGTDASRIPVLLEIIKDVMLTKKCKQDILFLCVLSNIYLIKKQLWQIQQCKLILIVQAWVCFY